MLDAASQCIDTLRSTFPGAIGHEVASIIEQGGRVVVSNGDEILLTAEVDSNQPPTAIVELSVLPHRLGSSACQLFRATGLERLPRTTDDLSTWETSYKKPVTSTTKGVLL